MILTLIQNIALLVALSVVHQWIVRRWRDWTVLRQSVSGLLFGAIAVVGMMTPFRPLEGIQYDGRSIIIAVAGVFGGPVAGGIAAAIAAAYRIWLGGAGAVAGVSVVVGSAALGIAYYYLRQRTPKANRWPPLYALALAVHVLMLALQYFLLSDRGPSIVAQIWFPVLGLYPVGMLLVCRLMLDQEQMLRDEQDLRDLNETLEQTVDERTQELQAANQQMIAASQELLGANESLQEASDAKSQFMRAMSHELRTPLNSIIGFSDLLLKGHAGAVNAEQTKQLEMINGSGKRLLAIINDILDLARIEAHAVKLTFELFDAGELSVRTTESLRPDADAKRIRLVAGIPDGPVMMTSDPLKVGQVLLNLVSNAIKFTNDGEVTVTLRPADHGVVAFEITDTGAGIPEPFQEQVFGEFVQRDERAEGTGLGLAISRSLAELLGGTITLVSTPGSGSTFTLLLPQDSSPARR